MENFYDEEHYIYNICFGSSYTDIYSEQLLNCDLSLVKKNTHFRILKVPDFLLTSSEEKFYKHGVKKEFSKRINIFIREIKKNIPGVNLSAFYETSKGFSFIKHPSNSLITKIRKKNLSALFVSMRNHKSQIELFDDLIDESIYHEFLHMASHRRVDDDTYQGFEQSRNNVFIGNALNEGYTDLLTLRYFTNHGATSSGYALVIYLSSLIEFVVGKENMQKWYFESNLYALKNEMAKYLNNEEFIFLLNAMDYINKHCYSKLHYRKVKQVYKEVVSVLTKIILIKFYELYKNGTDDKIIEVLEQEFLDLLLGSEIEIDINVRYTAYTEEEIGEIFDKLATYHRLYSKNEPNDLTKTI